MRKKAKLYLAERAIRDLQEIESYSIGQWGKVKAEEYLDAFERFFSLVESQPEILIPIPNLKALLTHAVEKHVVVCTKWNQDLLVLTIVHSSREILVYLDKLLPTLNAEVNRMKDRLD
ncbi:MAG: type II toxin-antitoxin system RelE/ParE family toxin [Planctomycetaceae bacterium]|nr:type II toxin-antitoxin system RelE/ParE family toxin [Planctomycetaceae bacterium]